MTDADVAEYYRERVREYQELNARAHADDDAKFIIDCPDCETPMVLGQYWKGVSVPACPDCNDTADTWAFEPRISEERADEIAADETDISELVRA